MKYRDLVFVLMLVAVGVMWLAGPQSAATEAEPQPMETVAKTEPVEAKTPAKLPPKIKVTPQPQRPLVANDIPVPLLEITTNQPDKLDDLVISAQLTSPEPFALLVDKDGDPSVNVIGQAGEKVWSFRTHPLPEGITQAQAFTDVEWEIRLSELKTSDELEQARKAFVTEEIEWTVMVDKAPDKADLTTRMVVLPPLGGFTTKP